MVIKINYTSSDIYVSTNVSPVYVVVNYSAVNNGGGAVWGGITGTLSDQTDLQNALNAKFDDPTGTTAQYLRGDGSLATFPTIPSGTVTSVGLTMPSAFSVANSPVTSNGTIAVTGAGTADQYVRGDGQLANFPTNQGGGSSVNYYLNGSVNQGSFGGDIYYEMSKSPIIGAGTNFTRTNAQGNGYIASFITDAGEPALLNIPGGNWNIEFYFQASSGGGNPSFYTELYKVSSSNVFTLIATGSTNPEGITQGTVIDQYFTSIPVPQTALLATDRLAIRIFVTPSGRTITLHTENSNLCEVLTTFSTGLNALNGLTSQVQYFATGTSGTDFAISSATDTHTFNLPTASGTNRGALSSADWSTFNSKVGGSGATGQVAYWNGTNSQTGSNNLFWDAANSRLGIGTNAPTSSLDIVTTNSTNATFINESNFITNLILQKNQNPGNNDGFGLSFRRSDGTISAPSNLEINRGLGYINFTGYHTGAYRLAGGIRTAVDGSTSSTSMPMRFEFLTSNDGSVTPTIKMMLKNNGNLILENGGTFTDGGQRLQVYGDAFIKGSGATSATIGLQVQNSASTNLLRVQNNGIVSIGSGPTDAVITSGQAILKLNGPNTYWTIQNRESSGLEFYLASYFGPTPVFVIGDGRYIDSVTINGLFSRTFAPVGFSGTYTSLELRDTINQTGGASGITRGLHIKPTLTSAADWRSIEWSNNSGWGLYGAGTANNYLGGDLTFGNNKGVNLSQAGTNRSSRIYAADIADNFAGYAFYPSAGTNVGNAFQVIPRGTGFNSTIKSQIVVFNTDFVADSTNYELAVLRAGGTNYSLSTGKAGTGTTRPLLLSAGFATDAVTNGNQLWLYTSGRVGINTTSESTFTFDVNGTARVSGDLTISNNSNSVLYSSKIISGTNGNNIFIGGGGQSINGTGSQSSWNTSLGLESMNSLTTGSNNTTIGWYSGRAITTGNENILIGRASGYQITTANQNTALGGNTLFLNIVGTFNTAVGYQALNSTTASNNTAIGWGAGFNNGTNANTTGGDNIFIGRNAIGVSPTESNRTWIGNSSTISTWLGGNLLLGTTTNGASFINVGAGTTAKSQINLASSTAPTSPNNGDIWFDGTDLKMRIGGVTKTFTLV